MIGVSTPSLQTLTMIARGKILQMAVAAFAAYSFFTVLVSHLGSEAWTSPLPPLSQNLVGSGVFDHIQNRTLGVSSHFLFHKSVIEAHISNLVRAYICSQHERANRQARFPDAGSCGVRVQSGMARWSTPR